jgi:NAD(P)H-dependent FMN reductase
MKIAIIVGSHRPNSESLKVGSFVQKELENLSSETYLLNLGENILPLWDEGVWENDPKWDKVWSPISNQLTNCDGFVIISPEYGGMATPALKNFFLLCGNGELAHKPAVIIGVSASRGGSYPIAELRMSSYKNTQIVYLPDHIIVREVESVLNNNLVPKQDLQMENEVKLTKDDIYIRSRINYSLQILLEYAKNLEMVRKSGKINLPKYPYGM